MCDFVKTNMTPERDHCHTCDLSCGTVINSHHFIIMLFQNEGYMHGSNKKQL